MPALFSGTAFALAAGLMWGLVFVAPLMLPQYPPALLAVGRYLAFGLICLPLALVDWRSLRTLNRSDWGAAARLSLIGNFLYYLALAAAIQRAGSPLVSAIIGTLPVVIAVASNRRNALRDGMLPWSRLAPSLVLMLLGIACVNQAELARLPAGELSRYVEGGLLAVLALACWTWYPIKNADWLRAHAGHGASAPHPRAWATAQGLVTLPMALVGLALLGALQSLGLPGISRDFPLPLGPEPLAFLGLMLTIGLFSSWGGTLCWNEASQRLPTTLVGQLIVFETLAALSYGYLLRGEGPAPLALLGIALLVGGVVGALRAPSATAASPH